MIKQFYFKQFNLAKIVLDSSLLNTLHYNVCIKMLYQGKETIYSETELIIY